MSDFDAHIWAWLAEVVGTPDLRLSHDAWLEAEWTLSNEAIELDRLGQYDELDHVQALWNNIKQKR